MSGATWQLIEKDLRALLPTWGLFTVSLIVVGRLLGPGPGLLVYLLGTTLLGALVVGHEYSHRTMAGLLALPIARRRVLLLKFAVLVLMLAACAAVAVFGAGVGRPVGVVGPGFRPTAPSGTLALVGPALCALCVTPWLTLLGRSPLAGAVFAGATFCITWVAGQAVSFIRYGFDTGPFAAEIEALRLQFAWRGLAVACAIGFIGAWVTFARLQATEHLSLPAVLPRWLSRARGQTSAVLSNRRHWVINTIAKEVRLQLMAFIVAGLYLVMWLVIIRTRPMVPEQLRVPLAPLSGLYGVIIGLLIGSFGSAEERHLGMHAWHSLLPVSTRKQWIVKLVSVLGLAVALGAGIPWGVQQITAGLSPFNDFMYFEQPLIVAAIALGSLYVSTLTSSGLRALVASVTVLGSGALVFPIVLRSLFQQSALAFVSPLRWLGWYHFSRLDRERLLVVIHAAPTVLVVPAVVVILWLAKSNHASLEPTGRVIRRQVVWILGFCVFSTISLGAVQAATTRWWRYTGDSGVKLTGRVEFDGTAPRPEGQDLDEIWLTVEGEDHDAYSVTGLWKNGRFATPYFSADKYTVRVPMTYRKWDKAWKFKGATYQGRDITDTPIGITTNLDDVLVTFTDHAGKVDGKVRATEGIEVLTTIALMFPVERSHWKDYGFTTRRIHIQAVASDGSFNWTMPPEGDYYLAAVSRDRIRGFARLESWTRSITFDKDPSPLFESLAKSAEQVHAIEGAVLMPTLTVVK